MELHQASVTSVSRDFQSEGNNNNHKLADMMAQFGLKPLFATLFCLQNKNLAGVVNLARNLEPSSSHEERVNCMFAS